jgi:hypothetical protein
MSVSKQFKNAINNGDYSKAIRTINRIGFVLEKNLERAADHYAYLIKNTDIDSVILSLSASETKLASKFANAFKATADVAEKAPKGLTDKFEAMGSFVSCVAQGYSNGVFIAGAGGTGKSWTVTETLEGLGLEEDVDYVVCKGASSAFGLYITLYENSDKLIVFDDMDDVFKDQKALNVLKAVLDTYPKRTVSWNSSRTDDIPNKFTFTGRIIFISNHNPSENSNSSFKAVMTRVLSIVVGGTKEEVRDRIISLLPKIAANLDSHAQKELADFIKENYRSIPELSLRFLVHVTGLYQFNRKTWKDLAFNLSY